MAEQVVATSQTQSPSLAIPETIVPVSAEEYMAQYAHDHYEWEQGKLVKMSPVTDRHDELSGYLHELLKAYFALNPVGRVKRDPFVMRLDALNVRREPDLQVILTTNSGQFTDTVMIGPADICIEIISPESVERDYGRKFVDYESGGVKEYWLIDPIRGEARISRLSAEGHYQTRQPDADGYYETPLLPGLRLHVPTLWQDRLPDIYQVTDAVRAMLAK